MAITPHAVVEEALSLLGDKATIREAAPGKRITSAGPA
jgi:hypothetical protein